MRLGGIVGPILQQGNAKSEVLDGDHVNNDCDRSSKSFAQAFLYGSKVARQEMEYPAMAFGSDFNGIIESPAPRFGSDACGGNKVQALLQKNRVSYPFESRLVQGVFDQQVTGERRFDINTDGFAHVGLLPDFIEDLSQIGVEENELNLLFRSAEAYLRTWEKAEAR